eukprot:10476800-Ditylum_brightwellii.AAC.1
MTRNRAEQLQEIFPGHSLAEIAKIIGTFDLSNASPLDVPAQNSSTTAQATPTTSGASSGSTYAFANKYRSPGNDPLTPYYAEIYAQLHLVCTSSAALSFLEDTLNAFPDKRPSFIALTS